MNVIVSKHTIAMDAYIVKGRLEAEGIPAYVSDDGYVTMDWTLSVALDGVKVSVPEAYQQEALAILQDTEDGNYHLNQLNNDELADDQLTLTHEQANEYLPEEPVYCPKCKHSDDTERVEWFRQLSLGVLFALQLPLAFSKRFYTCTRCNYTFAASKGNFSLFMQITVALLSLLLALFLLFNWGSGGLNGMSQVLGPSDTIILMDDMSEGEPEQWPPDESQQ